tara:strand:+ start:1685 stop:1819 length:135 start_codon:yes stop_codon:yes gene_type:complete
MKTIKQLEKIKTTRVWTISEQNQYTLHLHKNIGKIYEAARLASI